MIEVTIPKGTIVDTFPLRKEQGAYRVFSKQYSTTIFIYAVEGISQTIEMAMEQNQKDQKIYAPCVIERMTNKKMSYHQAHLLIPPETILRPDLLVRGLMIPDLYFHDVQMKDGKIAGFYLFSDYARRRFFVSSKTKIDQNQSTRYLGLVSRLPKNKQEEPETSILHFLDVNESVFQQNSEKLDKIVNSTNSSKRFWWQI